MRRILAIFLLLALPSSNVAQNSANTEGQKPSSEPGGMSTGGAYAPILDAEHRPITAGGFVDKGPVVYQDVTASSGLATWRHAGGTPEKHFILETLGSGVALVDFDNDGWMDIYLVNSESYPALMGKELPTHAALFHNNHDGTFTDVARKAGVLNDRWGVGVAAGDYDNDGWPDLYVTNFGKNRLYHNNHDGTFTDVAEKAGVEVGTWSTGPTFGDYDHDGRLDIFVPGYVHYENNRVPLPGEDLTIKSTFCKFRGVEVMCGPRGLKGEQDHLFHNNGDGTFTDVSVKAGVQDALGYYGLTGVFVDVNNDGRPDLVVTNDSTPSYLYLNKGGGTFEDASFISGYAFNQEGREIASMGVAVGDYRNNGLIDLFNTDFSDDNDVLYRNDGDASFSDVSGHVGLLDATIPFLGWGTGFLDYDNDGWKDLFVVNGHVYPAVDQAMWGTSFAERPLLFRNLKGERFELVPPVRNTGLAVVVPGRGGAFGDLFNDGKMDVVINAMDHTPVLLRNVNDDKHHWIALKLTGGAKSPRDAVGATVYLTAGGMRQRGDVISGGSFASSNDLRVHFGLGDAASIEDILIAWPSGATEHIRPTAVDRILNVEEGKGVTGELCVACSAKKPTSTERAQ